MYPITLFPVLMPPLPPLPLPPLPTPASDANSDASIVIPPRRKRAPLTPEDIENIRKVATLIKSGGYTQIEGAGLCGMSVSTFRKHFVQIMQTENEDQGCRTTRPKRSTVKKAVEFLCQPAGKETIRPESPQQDDEVATTTSSEEEEASLEPSDVALPVGLWLNGELLMPPKEEDKAEEEEPFMNQIPIEKRVEEPAIDTLQAYNNLLRDRAEEEQFCLLAASLIPEPSPYTGPLFGSLTDLSKAVGSVEDPLAAAFVDNVWAD